MMWGMPPEIRVYTTHICPYCFSAKRLLERHQLPYIEISVEDPEQRAWLVRTSGKRTVPQIYIGDYHVGGSDELHALERSGKLFDLTGVARPVDHA
jgi:glutaredoxin 3